MRAGRFCEVEHIFLYCRTHVYGSHFLLNRGDLHQLPAADRTIAVLQRDHQVAALLLELNQRQAVVGQCSHHDRSSPHGLLDHEL